MKLAAALLLVVAGAAAAVVLHEREAGGDVRGSSTVEFVPATLPPAPARRPSPLAWPMFGRDAARGATLAARIRPPYRRVWTAGGRSLLEFPPAISYRHLYYGDGGGRVYAVSTATGSRDWRFDAHRSLAATPAIGPYAHGTVYEAFLSRTKRVDDGLVVALAAGTGAVRWRARVAASETSPLLVGSRLYVGGWNGMVYALDARTGRRLWTFLSGGAVKGGLAAVGGRVFAGSYDGHVYALDAGSGRLVWRASAQRRLFGHGRFYSTPAVAYGRVYIGCTDGRVYSFGAKSGRLRWSTRTGSYVYGSPAVWNELVLAGSYDRHFYAFDAATGAVRWRFDAGGAISGSATVIAGVVYFATLSGSVFGLDARNGRLLWHFPDGMYAPPVSDGRRLYVAGYSTLYGFAPRR